MKKLIVCWLCLLCFATAGCGKNMDNESALEAIEDGFYEEPEDSWETGTEPEIEDESRITWENGVKSGNEEIELNEPENGHIIAHNPEYLAPVYTPDHRRESNGMIIDGSFSYVIPEDYLDTVIGGSLIYVMDEDKGSHSIYVYTEDILGLNSKEVLEGYDKSIKDEFGEIEEEDIEEHNGLEYNHYLYDQAYDSEHGFVNIYVFANETALIYIEFYDTATVYDEAVIREYMDDIFFIG